MNIVKHTFNFTNPLKKRAKTTEIILHCAATPEGKDYTVDQIHKWHLQRSFSGIGYNYVIYRDGTIHQGRPEEMSGAHATNHNSISVGICYIGGMDKDNKKAKDTRTPEQKKALVELVDAMMKKYNVPLSKVYGHYNFANKACPSFKIEGFRDEIKEYNKKKNEGVK